MNQCKHVVAPAATGFDEYLDAAVVAQQENIITSL